MSQKPETSEEGLNLVAWEENLASNSGSFHSKLFILGN